MAARGGRAGCPETCACANPAQRSRRRYPVLSRTATSRSASFGQLLSATRCVCYIIPGIWPESSKYIEEQFAGLSPEIVHKITCENAAKFYGLIN